MEASQVEQVEVAWGHLEINHLNIRLQRQASLVRATLGDTSIDASLAMENDQVKVGFARTLIIQAGQHLRVTLS